eukprot:scaffold2.g7169.t1
MDQKEFFAEATESQRYRLTEVIGKGSYGVVASAVDQFTGEKVAIKKITNVFDHVSDATRILREIKLLRLLRHPDIVEIKHIMLPPSPREFKDIYVVFELMETDLHQVIKANDDLTPEHHQFFLYQTVFWTDYVATRWYRAPELCGSFFAKYSPAIDIWSIGCIFAEILLGKPLFPGRNVVHQLELITDLLGTPSPEVINKVRNEKARRFLMNMRKKAGIPFEQHFPKADKGALLLLRRLLAFDPAERPTAEEALADPYFAGLSQPSREPSAQPISKLAFEFERRKLAVEEVRDLIYREILEYHPQMLADFLAGGHRQPNFVYPSAVDHFKRQFAHLEAGGRGAANPHLGQARRRGALRGVAHKGGGATSLPRERMSEFRSEAQKYLAGRSHGAMSGVAGVSAYQAVPSYSTSVDMDDPGRAVELVRARLGTSVERMSVMDAASGYPTNASGYLQQGPLPGQYAPHGHPPPQQQYAHSVQQQAAAAAAAAAAYGAPPGGQAGMGKHLAAAYQQQQQSLLRSNSAV